MTLDHTHDAARRSWIAEANRSDCDFPLQNLPLGVYANAGAARVGVAIGDQVLDVVGAAAALGFTGDARVAADACRGETLNALAALGRPHARALRHALFAALVAGDPGEDARRRALAPLLVPQAQSAMRLPFAIGDYTDFYSSIFHARNVGALFRPDDPLTPNYRWVPIGYHGRASSVVVSGTSFPRPSGQLKPPNAAAPVFGPCKRLDYEVELGFFIGRGNALGTSIATGDAQEHVFGAVLLCDWSARDIQAWEYVPLGPFLAKSFATTISPWVVTLDALAPFRCPAFTRAPEDPAPLAYLHDETDLRSGGYDITVEVELNSAAMRAQRLAPMRLSRANYRDAYWTLAQLVAHHTSNGCNLQPGDLLGSGTISGAGEAELGSLIELTRGGQQPIALPGAETRAFLADGDEITLRAACTGAGRARIGFGQARGLVK
jgi:fumarylacetoacetase